MRAGGSDKEEAEGDAAELQVLPQRVGDVGPPDRPRHPHDRRAPASPVHVHPMVGVPMPVAMVVVVVAVAVVMVAAVGAGGEGQEATREEERGFRS